jgi:DNA-binding response OmpR family regulator
MRMRVQTGEALGPVMGGVEVTGGETTSGAAMSWHHEPAAEGLARGEIILFVEDETFVREVTSEVLLAAGYEVLIAANAVEARQLYELHSGAVNLLLTDIVLPGETGRELAARLSHEDPRMKILFVTGYPEQMKMVQGQEWLAKPFSASALLEKVKQIIGRSELAHQELGQRALAAAV